MPLEEFTETYLKPAAIALARKLKAGEALDEIEKSIIIDYFESTLHMKITRF